MSKHSKNCTSLAYFTYSERQKLKYGTQKERLGRDSLRGYASCFLCLTESATDPLACPQGHLACKECIYENILAQKKEIARLKHALSSQERDKLMDEHKNQLAQEEAELQKFESIETRFLPTESDPSSSSTSKHKLPSFWIPSLTPSAKSDSIDATKLETVCTAVEKAHPINIKKLMPIKFTPASKSAQGSAASAKQEYMCPACLKTLRNGTKMQFPKACGHVICSACAAMFNKKTAKCYVCEAKCRDKDMVQLYVEGTGFASGGKSEAKKEFVAFQ
ncbi:hypothetical protein SeMB42_g02633 [Synchytrium endobioticum]|uniref:RING-type domain-containing protein n=1 Tax=Synchytrium endobioticum TaxID=286115 RepID=A0A507D8I6_9FUNG|nr:hypothetical protein SeLEV6574_g02527 [Synchytrium endobioticum]TPX49344.1 hypothetical protein SeMB42_g02633 [Synchytrium endobioticum]